ncbi:sensor histidine kinase [Amycolatopsis sp. H20-H5]|uniref:sensor histidine kinase n=1 Tax=Amycolatopsis sp. H20-H5 TaxID=3046309 RepID=UPI002DBC5536|nr:sensor histidine kinase [Amycolatopsis sp. H20-H5]MEC3979567.1 sensor histidine kinase [Amycolatopsis sp. H20-H5]
MNAWERWFWLWEVLFAIAFLSTAGLILADDGSGPAKWISLAAVVGLPIAYLALGRRFATRAENPRQSFVFVILALFLIATLADGTASFILFAVCPLMFMTLELKPASVLVTCAILVSPLSSLIHDGADSGVFLVLLPMTVLLIVFSLLMGRWSSQIIEQSKERAELIEQLEASQAEVSRLSREAGTAAERERLAREIHDTLAQGFTSIVALTQAIESEMDTAPDAARRHLDLARRTARENLAEARAMVAAMSPSALAAGSLVDALRRQAERLGEETAIVVSCEIEGPLPALGTPTEVVLLRGAQEALTNVRKHAAASAVNVRLSVVDTGVRLSVSDDGAGFDPESPSSGYGLSGMRARAKQVGGRVKVLSDPAVGTTIELEVPA